jgi:hypothetical protein
MSERFTEALRAASEPGWSRAVEHRFVKELFTGAVLDAVMARYLIQDHRFLDSFLLLLGAALAAADTFEARLCFARFIGMVSSEENPYFLRLPGARHHRGAARCRPRHKRHRRLQGDHARDGGNAQPRCRAFGSRGDRVALPRLGLTRAATAARQFCACGVDRAARQPEFAGVRRFWQR